MADITRLRNARDRDYYLRAFRALLDNPLFWLLLAGIGLALACLATFILCQGGYCVP